MPACWAIPAPYEGVSEIVRPVPMFSAPSVDLVQVARPITRATLAHTREKHALSHAYHPVGACVYGDRRALAVIGMRPFVDPPCNPIVRSMLAHFTVRAVLYAKTSRAPLPAPRITTDDSVLDAKPAPFGTVSAHLSGRLVPANLRGRRVRGPRAPRPQSRGHCACPRHRARSPDSLRARRDESGHQTPALAHSLFRDPGPVPRIAHLQTTRGQDRRGRGSAFGVCVIAVRRDEPDPGAYVEYPRIPRDIRPRPAHGSTGACAILIHQKADVARMRARPGDIVD